MLTMVLMMFVIFHICYLTTYKYIALRADCNSAAVSANITVSSAYSNKYNLKYTSISSLSNKHLTVVDEFQCPGTIFSRKGNFGRNKARLVQPARKAMFYVLRKARNLSLPIDILLQLFDAMVAPILYITKI
jgi:hypothetical protein